MWGDAPVDRFSPDDADRSASTDYRVEAISYSGLRAYSDTCVPKRAGGGV